MRSVLLFFFGLTLATPGIASDLGGDKVAGWQLAWDNDSWGKAKTDRWYTNGIRLSWTFNKPPTNSFTKFLLESSRIGLWHGAEPSLSYSVGQLMYSPQNISLSAPQPRDRPWGAYLYFGATSTPTTRTSFVRPN